jgi:hypothetical protein
MAQNAKLPTKSRPHAQRVAVIPPAPSVRVESRIIGVAGLGQVDLSAFFASYGKVAPQQVFV